MRGETSRPGKRRIRILPINEKVKAIDKVHEGKSKASVARDIGVPESTLRGWCKSEEKIRNIAKNSCTPDREAHSPASSSGALAGLVSTSEDEAGPSMPKKMKVEGYENIDDVQQDANPSKLDYSATLNTLVHSLNNYMMLQRLGMLQYYLHSTAASWQTNYLERLSNNSLGTGRLGVAQTVGLVENGLQYTKSSHKRSSSSSHISVIAPASHHDLNKSRKSLPATEAPLTTAPLTPRRMSESNPTQQSQQQQFQQRPLNNGSISGSKSKYNGLYQKPDEAFMLWLAQQQSLLGSQNQQFNPSMNFDASWFWQWYKQNPLSHLSSSPAQQQQATTPKSPSEIKRALDNAIDHNNDNSDCSNENNVQDGSDTENSTITREEALEGAEKFLKYITNSGLPKVSRLEVRRCQYLMDNVKSSQSTSVFKHMRKNCFKCTMAYIQSNCTHKTAPYPRRRCDR